MVPPVQPPDDLRLDHRRPAGARTNLDAIEEASKGQIKPGALAMTDPGRRLKAMDRQGVDVRDLPLACSSRSRPSRPRSSSPSPAPTTASSPSVAAAAGPAALGDAAFAEEHPGPSGHRWARQHGARSASPARPRGATGRSTTGVLPDLRGRAGTRHADLRASATPATRSASCAATDNRPSRWHMSVPTLMSFTALCQRGGREVPEAALWLLRGRLVLADLRRHPGRTRVRDDRDRKAFTQRVLRERKLYVTCEEHEELSLIPSFRAGDANLVIGSDYGHPGDVDETIPRCSRAARAHRHQRRRSAASSATTPGRCSAPELSGLAASAAVPLQSLQARSSASQRIPASLPRSRHTAGSGLRSAAVRRLHEVADDRLVAASKRPAGGAVSNRCATTSFARITAVCRRISDQRLPPVPAGTSTCSSAMRAAESTTQCRPADRRRPRSR